MVYSDLNSPKRTDESFRAQTDRSHHKGISPLLDVDPPIDLVAQFVFDFMHGVCLGVMKKLVADYWATKKKHKRKLSREALMRISLRLINMRNGIPLEFQSTTRDLGILAKWKATEFRLFLLYCGPAILKGILSKKVYQHFLLLHAACVILCSSKYKEWNDHAKIYLTIFVQVMKKLYGPKSQVYNVHSLIHLADDVLTMDCPLSEMDAFLFESFLGAIKRLIQGGYNPLQQLCNRVGEIWTYDTDKATIPEEIQILRKGKEDNGCTEIFRLKYKEFTLTNRFPNNVVLLKDKKIMTIVSMSLDQTEKKIRIYV